MQEGTSDRFESLTERLIREAIESGEFEDLFGFGSPLPGAGIPDEELWWVRDWMKRNGLKPGSGKPDSGKSSD